MLEQVLEYFAQGYEVYVEDYYGGYRCDDEEEIKDAFIEDDYFSVTIKIDDEAHKIQLFVSDDK